MWKWHTMANKKASEVWQVLHQPPALLEWVLVEWSEKVVQKMLSSLLWAVHMPCPWFQWDERQQADSLSYRQGILPIHLQVQLSEPMRKHKYYYNNCHTKNVFHTVIIDVTNIQWILFRISSDNNKKKNIMALLTHWPRPDIDSILTHETMK